MAGKSQWDKQLQDIKDKFAQTMKDAIASGVPKWQVRAANQQANKDLGQEALASLNTPTLNTINQFKTLTDTLSFLKNNAETLGLTIEDVGKVSSEVGTQMFVSLADSLMQNINNAQEAQQLNQIKWDLEVANYKLQVELLEKAGILTQSQIDFLNHEIAELPSVAPSPGGANSAAAINNEAANVQAQAAQTQAQAADNMQNAVDSLTKYNDSLLTDNSLSPLTPQQQLDAARAAYEQVAGRAQRHDATAIQDLPNVEKTFLDLARSFYGSSSFYSDIFNQIRGFNSSIIGANGGSLSSLYPYGYSSYGTQQTPTPYYAPSPSANISNGDQIAQQIFGLRGDLSFKLDRAYSGDNTSRDKQDAMLAQITLLNANLSRYLSLVANPSSSQAA